jgi:arabinose-5-phosphate isomerase
MHNIIKNCLEAEARAIMNIPADDTFVKAIDVFYHHVHEKGGKLVVSGMGKAGQIADNIATTFSSTGTPAIFLHPANAQHGDLGILCKNDVLLLISNSGKTREIIELVELAHNLHPEIPIVVITGNTESPLASIADIAISTGNPTEVCPLGLTPTTSTTTMTVIGDILVVLLMKKINFTAADYSKRHHGGYLGDRSRDMDAGNVNKK